MARIDEYRKAVHDRLTSEHLPGIIALATREYVRVVGERPPRIAVFLVGGSFPGRAPVSGATLFGRAFHNQRIVCLNSNFSEDLAYRVLVHEALHIRFPALSESEIRNMYPVMPWRH